MNYIEIPARDIESTKKFYTQVFNFNWIDYGLKYSAHQLGEITFAVNAEAVAAEIHKPQDQNCIGPFVLFKTNNITLSLEKVRSSGGEILSDIYPYPGGSRFHFIDPGKNVIGVYQSDE